MQRVHSAASHRVQLASPRRVELEESMLADGIPKIDEKKSRKTRFVRRPPLSRLCGDALRRCAAPSAARHAPSAELRAPPLRGATHAPRALRAGFLPEVRELIKDTRPKTNTTRVGGRRTALLLRLGLYTPPF